MFSVEQLVANDTYDRLKSLVDDHERSFMRDFGCNQAWVTSLEDALLFSLDEFPLSLVVTGQPLVDWRSEVRIALYKLYSILIEASAAVGYPDEDRLPLVPFDVLSWFLVDGEAAKASNQLGAVPLLCHKTGEPVAIYTWEGHALLCMWVLGEVSFPEETCPRAFKQLQDCLNTLTSITAIARRQHDAMRQSA